VAKKDTKASILARATLFAPTGMLFIVLPSLIVFLLKNIH
jgi:hypothetical protein